MREINNNDDKLLEKLFYIKEQVDYIYKHCFKAFLKSVNTNKVNDTIKQYLANRQSVLLKKLTTKDLSKHSEVELANNKQIFAIKCGVFADGSFVDYDNNIIQISINYSNTANRVLAGSFEVFSDSRKAKHSIPEERITSTIYHELSHWLSNSLYNGYIVGNIKNRHRKAQSKKMSFDDYKKVDTTNTSYFEIDAQIHAIHNLKRYNKNWDSLTIIELFDLYPSLKDVATEIYQKGKNSKRLNDWLKQLRKRMDREGLLGKSMRDNINFSDLIENQHNDNSWRVILNY